jgi:hypothetical protein
VTTINKNIGNSITNFGILRNEEPIATPARRNCQSGSVSRAVSERILQQVFLKNTKPRYTASFHQKAAYQHHQLLLDIHFHHPAVDLTRKVNLIRLKRHHHQHPLIS